MRLHITSINGVGGVMEHAQGAIAGIARQLGFVDMSIYAYPVSTDSDNDLQKRLDGTIAGVHPGDIVVMQCPTWNGTRYDIELVKTLHAYGARVAMLVHDVPSILNPGTFYTLESCIDIYNMSDLLILPSEKMEKTLRGKGLQVTNVMYQQMFDYPLSTQYNGPEFIKKMYFTGPPTRYPFVFEWKGNTAVDLYCNDFDIKNSLAPNVKYKGVLPSDRLVGEMAAGGYGFVWADGKEYEYSTMNLPYKFGTYLAAGIPVIARKGMNIENFILNNDIGYVVSDLEEADRVVQNASEQDYKSMVANVKRIQFMVTNGMFTKKLLLDVADRMNNLNVVK